MDALPLDNTALLLRFLFLGNDKCHIISKRKPLIEANVESQLKCIAEMAVPPLDEYPFKLIERVIFSRNFYYLIYRFNVILLFL